MFFKDRIREDAFKKWLSDFAAKTEEVEKQPAVMHGGIDLGHGGYLKVISTDTAGMPQFDPAQLQQLQKDLRGLVPVPVGVPQPVNVRPLLGLDPNSGNDDVQVGARSVVGDEALI